MLRSDESIDACHEKNLEAYYEQDDVGPVNLSMRFAARLGFLLLE